MRKLFLVAAIASCLFVACGPVEAVQNSGEVAVAKPSAVPAVETSLGGAEEPQEEEPVEAFVIPEAEDYAPQAGGTMYNDLAFLNESQLATYEQAMALHPFMNYNNEGWPSGEYSDDKPEPEHPIEGGRYYPAGGGYEQWDDFYAYWVEAFAPDYFDKLLESYGTFIEHEGYTWYAGGAACGHAVTELAYEVVTATSGEIGFVAYGYAQGHSGEYYEDSYEVMLMNTGNGWRCSYLSLLGTGER